MVEENVHAAQQLVWGRTRIEREITTPVENIDFVFSGHTILRNGIAVLGNSVFIDTGSYLEDGKITLVNLDEFLETH